MRAMFYSFLGYFLTPLGVVLMGILVVLTVLQFKYVEKKVNY